MCTWGALRLSILSPFRSPRKHELLCVSQHHRRLRLHGRWEYTCSLFHSMLCDSDYYGDANDIVIQLDPPRRSIFSILFASLLLTSKARCLDYGFSPIFDILSYNRTSMDGMDCVCVRYLVPLFQLNSVKKKIYGKIIIIISRCGVEQSKFWTLFLPTCVCVCVPMKSDKKIAHSGFGTRAREEDVGGNGFQINKNIYQEQRPGPRDGETERCAVRCAQGASERDKWEETIFTSKTTNMKHG